MTFDVIDNAGNYVTVNGTLNEGCVLGFPLTQTATGVDPVYGNAVVQATYSDGSLNETDPEITKFTFSADQTINCVTGVTLTAAQAAESGMVLSGTNKTLTLKCALPQASCCARVCGSLGLTLNATAASNVQSFNMRTNTTTGALTVTKGVFEIGEGASFPNVSGVSIGAEGELRVTTAVADPIPTTTVLDLPIGAKISVASGASVSVDSVYLNGAQQSAQMLRDAGVVTGAGTFTVNHGPIVISEDTTLTTLPADAHYLSSNGSTLTLNLTEDVVFAGSFGGNLKVVKADATTLTLAGVNAMPTFSVSAGTLVLANEQALSESATLTVADGAAVRLDEAMAGRTVTVGTLNATGNITLWTTNETTLVVNTLTCSGSAYATVNDRDTDVMNGTVTIGTTTGFAGGTIEACSGTLEMSDLSYIQNPTNLITGYGTLYYTGAATTNSLALKTDIERRTSVVKSDNNWMISCLTNLSDNGYSGLLKVGDGNVTIGGTDRIELCTSNSGNVGSDADIYNNGDSPLSKNLTLVSSKGLLTIGVKDDPTQMPTIDVRTTSIGVGLYSSHGDNMLSFDNGVVTNISNIYGGFYGSNSSNPKTATVRWCGGKTYAVDLRGNYADASTAYYGNVDFIMEDGEAKFSSQINLSYYRGAANTRCRLLITGGEMSAGGNLYLARSDTYTGADCIVSVGPGTLSVQDIILHRITKGAAGVTAPLTEVWVHTGGTLKYRDLKQISTTEGVVGGSIYGNGGVWMPISDTKTKDANEFGSLEHVYASTNGFKFSTAISGADWYTIVKGIETEPGLAQDGGFEVMRGQVRLAAACTFNGPLKVTGGTLALGTTETTAASFVNVTSLQVADGAQLNVEATVPFATDVALTLVTGAVVDIADGETLTVGTATLNGTAMTAADLRTAGVVTGTGTLVVLNEPADINITEDTTLTELAPAARYSSSNGSTLTANLASDTVFGGTFGGNLKLVKTGTGNLTLTSASTIDTIAVSNGTLTAAGGATSVLPATAIFTVTRGATVNIAAGSTLAVARIVVDGIRLNERQLRARGHVTGAGTLQLDPIPYLIINEDNDHFFKTTKHQMSAAYVDEYAESMTTGAVTHVFWTCCGQRPSFCPTNTATAWDPIWYEMDNDALTHPTNHRWAVNAKALHDQGVDPYERWLARCRQNGVEGFISMRMNDHHHTNITNSYRSTSFWRTNQQNYVEEWIPDAKGQCAGYHTLDYGKDIVREYHMAMVDEILSRWDLDGIELDFMRSPVYFKTNAMDIAEKAYRGIVSPENAALMTAFVAEVRRKANARAVELGHPVQVAVRVPRLLQGSAGSNNVSKGARSSGLYVDDWAESNYVDMVIFSGSQQDWPYDITQRYGDWQAQIDAHPDIVYLPGMDDGVESVTTHMIADLTLYRGYASDAYEAGAKGLYLFNLIYLDDRCGETSFFIDGRIGQQAPIYQGVLDPEKIGCGEPRRYLAKRIYSKDPQVYKALLPETLPSFNAASVTFCYDAPQDLDTLEIYLNGHRVDEDNRPKSVSEPLIYSDEDGNIQYSYVWDIPNEWVVSGRNVLACTNFVSVNTIAELALDMPHENALYGDGLWASPTTGGAWEDGSNWVDGTRPQSMGQTATFPEGTGADPTIVTVGGQGKDPTVGHIVVSNGNYRLVQATDTSGVLTLADPANCGLTVLGTTGAGSLEIASPVVSTSGEVCVNSFDIADADFFTNAYGCGRVVWSSESFTGDFNTLVHGYGYLDFPTAASMAFIEDASQLRFDGLGTVRYLGTGPVSIGGFTLNNAKYSGANSFAVPYATATVSVNRIVSRAGKSKIGLYKSGLGTLRIVGTAESVIGGGQIYGLATNNEQLVGITANGSVWTNRVQNLTVAEGTFVVGTVNDPSDAPIVTVPCTAAIGSYGIANDAELVLNNGSLTVTDDSMYVGYWSLGTNKTNRLTLNGGCLTVANGSLNLLLGSSYSGVSFRDASSAEIVINGGELNVSKAVSIGCTRSKSTDSRIAITMNDGLWTVGSSMRFGYVYSQTITTFTGNGGRLEIAGMLDTSYKNTDSSRPCTLDFNSGFVLKVPTIAATKSSGPTTVTFDGGAWEQPLGKNALIASNKVVTVGANGWTIVTTNVLDGASGANVLTVDQVIAGTGDITVAGNGRFAFGESFTNSTWTGALVLARPDAAALEVPADVTVTVDELRVPAGTTAVCVQDGTVYVRALYVGGVRSFTMPCSGTGTLIIDNSAIDITTDTTLTELQPGATYTSSNGSTLTLDLASDTTFDGVFTGKLKLAKAGAGTLTLTGANTATNITVASGTLALGTGGSLSTDTVLYLVSGAVFDLPSGMAQTVSAAYLNLAWKSASALRTLEAVTGEGTLTVTNEPTAPTPAPVPTAEVIVLSHRGGRSENTSIPENTVEKFQASAADGNKAFETDVKMTADGELVISHSSLLGNYITGAEGQIEYTNVVEVTNRTIKSTSCRIPTLDQLLEVFAAVENLQRIEFEMKVRTASGETGTLEFYRGENLTNYCNRLYAKVSAALPAGTYAFTSFDATTLQVMKALHPEASTGYIESNVISDNFITKAITYGCDSLSPKYPTSASDAATTATKIAAARARDLRVGLWMVDSYVTFTNSAAMGAYEITSDCPTTVRDEPVPPPGPEPEPTDVTTIALWPIEFGAETIGLASVGTVATPLTAGTRSTGATLPSAASIPAAYDFDPTLAGVDITNRTTYTKNTKVRGNSYHFTVGDDFGSTYCSHTNDAFTIEGFFSLGVLPTQWAMFVGSQYRTDVDNNFRWHVSLAPDANGFRFGYKPCWSTDDTSVYTPYLDDAQMLQLTNDWNHFAITYKKDDGSGLAWLRFYLNGTLLLDDHRAAKTPAAEEVSPRGNLDFGGISYSGSYCVAGAYDYIRVTDAALDPSRFLTATRYRDETSATIAYWKLDWTDEDLLNMHPSVGTRQLNGLIPGAASSDAIPSANADFINDDDAGTPSNLQMTPAATGSTANKGCLWLHGAAANVKQTGIASELSLTNAFTIEGWVRPFADSANTPQTLLTTDHATSGWTLSLASSGGNWFFKVYAGDGGTPLLGSGGTVVSAALTDVNSWRHIALAYDPTVGKGTWTFYIDGVQSGTAENGATPVNGSASTVLMFGITHNYGYRGYIDYVRVCRTALAPSQFLNAASGTAATDVLALWPLDVLDGDGARFDGRDAAAGTYPLAWIRTGNAYKVSKEASAPVITNPDRTPGFVGDPSEVESATEFFKSSSVGNRSYLMSMDANVLALLNSTSPYTIECFAKRNSVSITDTETYLFGSYCSVKGDGVTVSSLLGYKLANNGFFMHDRIWQGSDSGVSISFPQASAIEDGAWHHVAWQREFVDASTARYTLWVDGQCKGTADEATTSLGKYKATAFFVGGRPETSNAKKNQQWRGVISSVRVSNRVLAASEFLNAAPEKPLPEDAATTIAYWPLENRAGLPVMQSIVNARGASLTGADVAGSDAQAFIVCPNPDRSGAAFTADPNVNTGSVSVTAASVLTNGTLASSVALEQTFTIEGWIRRASVGETAETIVGTLDASGAGWRLYFDGTALKLTAKTGTSLPVLHEGATLVADVSGWTGRWTHLALERLSSAGQWKLFVDGIETVTLTDGWQGATGSGTALAFGGFTGELDMWRLSRGALTSELLLYADYLALDDTAGRLQVVLPAEYVDQFPGADKAEKLVAASNALLTVEANGNKSWLNYALGQDADTEVSIEVDQTATDKVGQRTSFSVPINKTGFRVTYEKIVRTASGTVTNAVKDTETGFDIPLTGTDPTGVYQVRTLVENTAQKDGPLSTDVLMEKVGVMRVAATGLQTNAIVAVPWEQLGAQTAVTVDKLIDVPASALADGDQLRVYDATGSYVFWYLDGGVWTSGTTVGTGGSVTAPAASETMVKRGDGVWLVRMKSAVANVYLVGRSSDTAAVTTLASGYNLVASPDLTGLDINVKFAGDTGKDQIRVPGAEPLNCQKRGGTWGCLRYVDGSWKWTAITEPLAVGTGFFYYNSGTSKDVTW